MHALGHDGGLICGRRRRVERGGSGWVDGDAELAGEVVTGRGRLVVDVLEDVVVVGEVVFEAGGEGEFFVEGRLVCGQGVEESGERAEAAWTDDAAEGVARGRHWGVGGAQRSGSERRAGRDEWRGEGAGVLEVEEGVGAFGEHAARARQRLVVVLVEAIRTECSPSSTLLARRRCPARLDLPLGGPDPRGSEG